MMEQVIEEIFYAKPLVDALGAVLVGRYVLTERVGAWPGGLAMVTEVQHDADAPEIVMLVKQGDECMGIFEDELLILIPKKFRLPDGIV